MKKSFKTALIASVALIAANIAVIDTAFAGKSHVRVRNTILGLGVLGLITNSHRHRHYDHEHYDHGYYDHRRYNHDYYDNGYYDNGYYDYEY